MDSFQEKEGWKTMWKSENKNYLSVPFLPEREIENSKTIEKKFKKLKNTITDSFQDNIGRKRPKKTENKSYRSVSFLSGTK